MVYGIASRVAARAIRETGAYLIPKAFKAFNKYDKALYRQVFGATRGKAIRHGRDAGLAIGGSLGGYGGDPLDAPSSSPPPSSPFSKAYHRFGKRSGARGSRKYTKRCRCNGQSRGSYSKPSQRRRYY